MSDPDESLLRDLIAKVEHVSGTLERIEQAVEERRSHGQRLEDWIKGHETRIRVLEKTNAKGESIPDMIADHEDRIRALEKVKHQVLALAFVGAVLGAYLADFLSLFG